MRKPHAHAAQRAIHAAPTRGKRASNKALTTITILVLCTLITLLFALSIHAAEGTTGNNTGEESISGSEQGSDENSANNPGTGDQPQEEPPSTTPEPTPTETPTPTPGNTPTPTETPTPTPESTPIPKQDIKPESTPIPTPIMPAVIPSPFTLDPNLLLLNELTGSTIFGIYTQKHYYTPDEDVWVTIHAPRGSPVELLLAYNGYKQYIKIPETATYPLEYLLPLPRNINEGTYILNAAMLLDGKPLRTQTMFEIDTEGESYTQASSVSTPKSPTANEDMTSTQDPISNPAIAQTRQQQQQTGRQNSIPPSKTNQQKEETPSEQVAVITGKDASQAPSAPAIEARRNKAEKGKPIDQAANTPIEIGKPVRWRKEITITRTNKEQQEIELLVNIPEAARHITAKNPNARNMNAMRTKGDIIITDEFGALSQQTYTIEFESPAPLINEEDEFRQGGALKKRIEISSPEGFEGEFQYTNVRSHTTIPESPAERVRLIWYENSDLRNSRDVTDEPEFDVKLIDTNSDSMIDRIEWITPHLSSQTFEVIIRMDDVTGQGAALDVNLLSPPHGTYFKEGTITLHYRTIHDSATTVSCTTTVDGTAISSMTNVSSNQQHTSSQTFEEGSHAWQVSCTDSLDSSDTSEERTFIVDTTPPQTTLLTPDGALTLTGFMALNFSVTDNLAPILTCTLTLDSLPNATISAAAGAMQSIALNKMANGTHSWSITCTDIAGNSASSETRTFQSYTEQEFSIMLDKETYRIGEDGYYIITGPHGAQVIVLFTHTATGTSFVKNYPQGEFPIIDMLTFTELEGAYTVSAIMTYQGATKQANASYLVDNSITTTIYTNKNEIEAGESITFEALNPRGGIGELTFTWDFKDETPTSGGQIVTHQFDTKGVYNVQLTIRDTQGNTKSFLKTVRVMDRRSVTFYLENEEQAPIGEAYIYVEETRYTTNPQGIAIANLFPGEYDILIQHPGYENIYDDIKVEDNTTYTFVMKHKNLTTQNPAGGTTIMISDTEDTDEENISGASEAFITKEGFDMKQVIEVKNAIEKALKNLDGYRGATLEMAQSLELQQQLEAYLTIIKRIERDINTLDRFKDDAERKQRLEEIIAQLNEMRKNVIVDLSMAKKNQFGQRIDEKRLLSLAEKYASTLQKKYTKDDISAYAKHLALLQSRIDITTTIHSAEATDITGDRTPLSLVEIRLSKPLALTSQELITILPSGIPEADAFRAITKATRKGSIVTHKISDETTLKFTLKADIPSQDQENIITIITDEPSPSEKKKGLMGVTGFAVFSKITSFDDPILAAEIALIILLVIAFLLFQFDIIHKLRKNSAIASALSLWGLTSRLGLRSKSITQLEQMRSQVRELLSNSKIEEAKKIMESAKQIASGISSKGKQQEAAQRIIRDIEEDITIKQMKEKITEALIHLKIKNRPQAETMYGEIAAQYKSLNPNAKARINKECLYLYEKILSPDPYPDLKPAE